MCYSVFAVQNLNDIEKKFGAIPYKDSFQVFQQHSLADPKSYKPMMEHPRIYPGYFAPIITQKEGGLYIEPMRYRVRPHGVEKDLPAKYNLYNARLDSIQNRKTWSSLFMKNHGFVVLTAFFEWVTHPRTKKKVVVSFYREGQEILIAPVLYDTWGAGHEELKSFAIITHEPPPEVLEAGHDRCPAFLEQNQLSKWLAPTKTSKETILEMLSRPMPEKLHAELVKK